MFKQPPTVLWCQFQAIKSLLVEALRERIITLRLKPKLSMLPALVAAARVVRGVITQTVVLPIRVQYNKIGIERCSSDYHWDEHRRRTAGSLLR
jgi:hypothetical protein